MNNTHPIQIKSESPRIFSKEWPSCSQWAYLKPGDDYVDESYPGSEYLVDEEWKICRIPMNITITGRKPQYHISHDRTVPFMRCKMELVRDGEPSEWMRGYVEMEFI